ncbi:hypothetical protein A9179_08290 [Pseudomonas alcaligenes]|uniref:Lipoprotein n=1 Tax=Aquipseudomonas alcaligenes TaxID=43263 RepID=A0ABR7RY54_AQUAC|nr:hypothetical protein [Pseudomonas alcaligenes]MBC9250271.1 hypothetical protein [Pseudomonas alcaligenes]
MSPARVLIFTLLPLFAGCQMFAAHDDAPQLPSERLQGELSQTGGQLHLQPCGEQRQLLLRNDGASDLVREAGELWREGAGPLFVDLRGQPSTSAAGADGELQVSEVYRIQHEGPGCADPDFKRLVLSASGHEPEWNLKLTGRGLVLLRPGQEPLALPYLEEQLPDGRFNYSSEANGQRLELWIAPQRCRDSMSGSVQHLSAELRLDGQVQRGCAAFGGARNH